MILDIIAALLISLGLYFGYQRGLIKTIFDTGSLLVAIIAALKLSPITIDLMKKSLNTTPSIAYIAGIVITFILVMVMVRFIGKKLEDVFKAVNLNFVNKISGGLLQGLFFAIVLSYAVSFLNNVDLIKDETKVKSHSYPYLQVLPSISQDMFIKLKPVFSQFWDVTVEAIDSVKEKVNEEQ
jgi:membrane protein required for colicin V production